MVPLWQADSQTHIPSNWAGNIASGETTGNPKKATVVASEKAYSLPSDTLALGGLCAFAEIQKLNIQAKIYKSYKICMYGMERKANGKILGAY